MEKEKKSEKVLFTLNYLKENPSILDKELRYPDIRLKFSNYQKKFSEFHRIEVKDKENLSLKKTFWIKILKNKGSNEIYKSLFKQYKVMQTLWQYFNNRSNISKGFLCCEPIALIPDLNALITKECHGKLFNTYLKSNIPFISSRKILKLCFKVGSWLSHFHLFYKNEFETEKKLHKFVKGFETEFNYKVWPQISYVTICHNDYSPRNIFVSSNYIEVIDYVGVDYGIPQEDIAFFANYIYKARFNLMYHKQFKRRMIEQFLEGYGLRDAGKQIVHMVDLLKSEK